jgi:hypothetical protein
LNPYPRRPDRLHLTLALGIVVLAVLSGVLYERSRRGSPTVNPPVAAESPASRPAPGSEATPGRARAALPAESPTPPAAAPGERRRTGRILGRVLLPDPDRSSKHFSYQIYFFGADGTLDGPRTFANNDRFELTSVPPGRKAVFFFSPTEILTCPYQIAVVPEGGDAEVELAPKKCRVLEGKLVDANSGPMGGLYVLASETIGLPQELYLEGKPASVARLDLEVTAAGATLSIEENPSVIPAQILKIHPEEGLVLRGTIASPQGKFSVPLSTLEVPVRLSVSRGPSEVIREEVVVPSLGPARIILPNQ